GAAAPALADAPAADPAGGGNRRARRTASSGGEREARRRRPGQSDRLPEPDRLRLAAGRPLAEPRPGPGADGVRRQGGGGAGGALPRLADAGDRPHRRWPAAVRPALPGGRGRFLPPARPAVTAHRRDPMATHDLAQLWEAHCRHEFETRDVDATMATMVAEPYVNHVPTMTGGVGHDERKRFYRYHF